MGADGTPSSERWQATADRVELTELLARYHQAIDGLDWDTLRRQVFAADAVCDYVGMAEMFGIPGETRGIDAIVEWLDAGLRPLGPTQHFMSNIVFEIDGDTARTRSYLFSGRGGRGVYECEHVRTPDGWRIRHLRLEHFFTDDQVAELRGRRGAAASGLSG
jgi:hypothetical protein